MKNALVNGIAYGYAEVVVTIDGQQFTAIKAINYKTTVERGAVRGTSMRKLAMTSGEVDHDGDVELAFDDYRALITQFGDGFLKRRFDVSIQFSNDDGINVPDGVKVYEDKLLGCRLKGSEHSHSQGPDGLTVKVPLDIMKILEGDGNGGFLDGVGSASI